MRDPQNWKRYDVEEYDNEAPSLLEDFLWGIAIVLALLCITADDWMPIFLEGVSQ